MRPQILDHECYHNTQIGNFNERTGKWKRLAHLHFINCISPDVQNYQVETDLFAYFHCNASQQVRMKAQFKQLQKHAKTNIHAWLVTYSLESFTRKEIIAGFNALGHYASNQIINRALLDLSPHITKTPVSVKEWLVRINPEYAGRAVKYHINDIHIINRLKAHIQIFLAMREEQNITLTQYCKRYHVTASTLYVRMKRLGLNYRKEKFF